MCKWFKEMDCYVLARAETRPKCSLSPFDKRAKLEQSFRNYAALFDNVKLVIKQKQAKEEYLNFPHVCDETEKNHSIVGVAKAIKDARSEALFIGSTDIYDFPLSLVSTLLKSYNGETFLGYVNSSDKTNPQPLFGIYNKNIADSMPDIKDEELTFDDLLIGDVKLLELPEDINSACIGL